MKTEKKIKVFLSDPQVLFREGIHFTLSGEEDFEVTGETTNNEDALASIGANPPAVAILNMEDGKLDGTEATRRIKRISPTVSVILVIDTDNEEKLFQAIKSGASACLNKDTGPDYLVDLIRDVDQGGKPIIDSLLVPGLASRLLAEFEALATLSEQLNKLLAPLSPKEIEVLNYIAAGDELEQVATRLSSDKEIVIQHLNLIADKLVANEQSKALIEATQRSLPSIMPGMAMAGNPTTEYVSREEFIEFKEHLMERLKSFIGELA